VSQSVFSQYLPFPLGGDAEHRIQVRLYARDAVGLTSDTIVSPPDSLRIYPTVSRPIRTTAIPLATADILIDQPRGLLYIRESDARWIKIRALSDLALVDSIALPAPATDFDLSAGGDTLIVTLPALGALGVVDRGVSPRETAVVPLASLDPALDQYPRAVRLAANGKAFVRLDGSSFPATVLLEVDLAAGSERIRTDAGDNGVVGYMAIERSHDHSTLILAGDVGVERYEAGVDSFVARNRTVSTFGQRARVDATGSRTALSHDVYDAALQLERRVAAPYYDPSIPVALSPDGRVLYHRGPKGVMRSDAETGELLDRTNLLFPIAAMRTTPDGASLVLYGGGVLSLMDVR
jgi:hypothetical protein